MTLRVLMIHDAIAGIGGGNCVAAWTLQALAERHTVTLMTGPPHDLAIVDAAFGTHLQDQDIELVVAKRRISKLLHILPFPLALLHMNLLFRLAHQLAASGRFDLAFSTMGEIDLGHPAVQYVHYPWLAFPRPDYDLRPHHFSILVRLYRAICLGLSGYQQERAARNLALTNSDWTGEIYSDVYHQPSTTLYPPAPGPFTATPWEQRTDTFLCIGRISPEKELLKVMRVLAAVRERGHDINLRLIGNPQNRSYKREVEQAAGAHGDWVKLEFGLPRPALMEALATSRYGIHGMEEEHFGIAVAEMLRAGCLPFVPNGGGAPEIIGRERALLYDNEADAIDRIDAVLSDASLRDRLRNDMAARDEIFSEQTFKRRVLEIVETAPRLR